MGSNLPSMPRFVLWLCVYWRFNCSFRRKIISLKFHLKIPPCPLSRALGRRMRRRSTSLGFLDEVSISSKRRERARMCWQIYLNCILSYLKYKYKIHVPNDKHLKRGRIDILICNSAKLTCWNNRCWECQIQGLKTFPQKTRFFCNTVTMFIHSKEQYIQRKLKYQFCSVMKVGRTEKYLLTPNIAHTVSCTGDIDVQLKHFKYYNVKIAQFSIEKHSIFWRSKTSLCWG